MDGVYVSINSKELMERLLSGKEDVLLKISNKILDEWSKLKVVPIFNEENETIFLNKFRTHIRKAIKEHVAEEVKLEEIDQLISQAVHKYIDTFVDSKDFTDYIDAKVKDKINKSLKKFKI